MGEVVAAEEGVATGEVVAVGGGVCSENRVHSGRLDYIKIPRVMFSN